MISKDSQVAGVVSSSRLLMIIITLSRLSSHSCQDAYINYSVTEQEPIGTFVGNIIDSSDLRSSISPEELQRLEFSFASQGKSYEDEFSLNNKTSVLTTAREIDRDSICPNAVTCTIELVVQIRSTRYFDVVKLQVEVIDINDNPPTFPLDAISRTITEASSIGSQITIPGAEDPDSPTFGIERYEIKSGHEMFNLTEGRSTNDLHLVLRGKLDRETLEEYTLTVIAYDYGNRSGSMLVTIRVLDVNDNNPRFTNQTYYVTVKEDVPQYTEIIRVTANDPDDGLNGEIVYGFAVITESTLGNLFLIDRMTGAVTTVGNLDYEVSKKHTLTVTAKDRNPNSIPARAKLIVQVEDVNDNSPSIRVNYPETDGNLEISEYTPNGTFLAHLEVRDGDSGEAGEFDCSLSDSKFVLQRLLKTQFTMVTNSTFNYEEQKSYDVVMRCIDKADEPQEGSRKFVINILDENDHYPTFSKAVFTVYIAENNQPGEDLLTLNATDRDSGENSQIHYLLANYDDVFHLDAVTGKLSVEDSLDRESDKFFNLTVIAEDRGKPRRRGYAQVIVHVLDEDDEVPTFNETVFNFSVSENLPSGSFVGRLSAFDKDSPVYNTLLYSFLDANQATLPFTIDATDGAIHTKQALDREGQGHFLFDVKVTSLANDTAFSVCQVSVRIRDENDNTPVFDFPSQDNNSVRYQLNKNVKFPQRVTVIRAHDRDEGINQELQYFIINSSDELSALHIDRYSGVLLINDTLPSNTYDVIFLVMDKGTPSRSITGLLRIEIIHPKSVNVPILIAILVVSVIIIIALIIFIIRTRKRIKKEKKLKWMAKMVDPKVRPLQKDDQSLKGSLPSFDFIPNDRDQQFSSTPEKRETPVPVMTSTPGLRESFASVSSTVSGHMGLPHQRTSIASSSSSRGLNKSLQGEDSINPGAYSNQGYDSSTSDNSSEGRTRHKKIFQPKHKIRKPAVYNPNPDQREVPIQFDGDDTCSVVDSGRGSTVSDPNISSPLPQPDLCTNYIIEEEDLPLDASFHMSYPDQHASIHRGCLRHSTNGAPGPTHNPPWLPTRSMSSLNVRFHLPEEHLGSVRSLDASTLSSMSTMSSYGGALI